MSKKETYFPELDGLRAFAFIGMFLTHNNPPSDVCAGLNRVSEWGWTTMEIFFALSGFLITYLLLRERRDFATISVKNFYMRRILRIWPVYYLVIAAVAIYPLTHFAAARVDCYWRYLTQGLVPFACFAGNYVLMFSHGVLLDFFRAWHLPEVHMDTIFLPFWSLCIEEQFYLLWPWLLMPVKRKRSLYLLFVVLTVASFLSFALTRTYAVHAGRCWTFFYYNTPTHIGAVMLGAMMAKAELDHPGWAVQLFSKWKGALALSALCLGFAALVIWMPPISDRRSSLDFILPLVCVGCALLMLLTMSWAPLKKFMSNGILLWLSRLTYSMYVVHFFICDICGNYIPPGMFSTKSSFWAAHLVLGSVLTVAAGWLSWTLLESRVLKLRKYFRRVKSSGAELPEVQIRDKELVRT